MSKKEMKITEEQLKQIQAQVKVRSQLVNDRTEDEVDELARNERHIQLKMAITQFVSGLSVDEKAKIDALKL